MPVHSHILFYTHTHAERERERKRKTRENMNKLKIYSRLLKWYRNETNQRNAGVSRRKPQYGEETLNWQTTFLHKSYVCSRKKHD